jgi:hypothetical protein
MLPHREQMLNRQKLHLSARLLKSEIVTFGVFTCLYAATHVLC